MKIILTIILTIIQLFVLVNIQSHAQVVDSPVDYQLTENDSINKNIMKMKGFLFSASNGGLFRNTLISLRHDFSLKKIIQKFV